MKQYTLLTANGINKLLKTASDGSKIALKEIVVSDYDGELSEQTTSIPNEKYRGAINAVTIDENDNNILDVDAIIPPEVGGFYIKTAGIYCDDGSLFAVARLADTYKPLLNEGSSKDITLNFKLQIANASESIILKVDNNIVLATRKWCEKMFLKLKDKIDAYTRQESDEKFALKTELTDGLPIGAYLSYPSQKTIPAGFLIADGRSLKKAEYTELFDVIGYTYGGSGQSFNLPNFSDGKFMRSIGGNAAALGTAQQDAFQGHFHKWKDSTTEVGWSYNLVGNTSNKPGTRDNISSIAEPKSDGVNGEPRIANETRPYNMAVAVIIKAKNVNTPTAGQIDKTILATETKAGITKLKNIINAKQEDAAVTERAISDVMETNKSIGIDQTWQDVLVQRKGEVLYTNTTGRPIMVSITADSSSPAINRVALYVGDVRVARFENVNGLATQLCAIVPDKKTYQLKSEINASIISIMDWVELR